MTVEITVTASLIKKVYYIDLFHFMLFYVYQDTVITSYYITLYYNKITIPFSYSAPTKQEE